MLETAAKEHNAAALEQQSLITKLKEENAALQSQLKSVQAGYATMVTSDRSAEMRTRIEGLTEELGLARNKYISLSILVRRHHEQLGLSPVKVPQVVNLIGTLCEKVC